LNLSSKRIPGNGQVTVRVDIQNSGNRAGDEVVQLYVHDVEASVKRPKKELRGFERVSLRPGEKKSVSFVLPAEKLAFWDVNKKAFVVEAGAFEVLIGSSSDDIRAKGRFEVTSAGQWPN
jgi:beta-glucosidase